MFIILYHAPEKDVQPDAFNYIFATERLLGGIHS